MISLHLLIKESPDCDKLNVKLTEKGFNEILEKLIDMGEISIDSNETPYWRYTGDEIGFKYEG